MNVTYLCLGGNIGDRQKALELANAKINQIIGEVSLKSPIYETEAWGADNQQAYLNQCIEVKTELMPNELILSLLSIEKELGRERSNSLTYQSRTIDIDILLYNNQVIETEELTVPHPRLHLRKFVLIPLNAIAPNYLHPIFNKTIFSLLNESLDHLEVKLFK